MGKGGVEEGREGRGRGEGGVEGEGGRGEEGGREIHAHAHIVVSLLTD